ncbi:pep-cterm sorting domain-containing protein [Anaeramoeba ignava]|uniref:Pep-cterm sorting domain-containing protein n=1 Tax=Anaeramoeba ignava TaxID=1746090 RepID=A0A9Q0R5B0_ANAIG|nr:pep-cterm sorting domain-containing protein [Anaeramoeba ignava]
MNTNTMNTNTMNTNTMNTNTMNTKTMNTNTMNTNTMNTNAMNTNTMNTNSMNTNAMNTNAMNTNAMNTNTMNTNTMNTNTMNTNTMNTNTMNTNTMNTNTMNTNTMNTNTMNTNAMNTNSMNTNLLNLPNNQLDALLSDECTIDLKALLKTEAALSDFTIICGKNLKEFRCHKLILSSRSQFFHSLFRQKDLEIINFAEFEYGIVDPVMGFLYTGEIKIPQQSFDSYHKLADKLILPKLKIKIEKDIQQSLNQDNLVDVYSKSKRISSDFLIQSCGDLLTQNIDQMIQSNQVQKINQHEVICFIEMMLLNKTTNKLKLIPGLVIEWFKYNELKPQREYSKLHLKNLQIPFYKSIFQLLEHIQYLYPISDYQMYQIQKFSFFPFETVVEIYNHHIKTSIQAKEQKLIQDKDNLKQEKKENEKKNKKFNQEGSRIKFKRRSIK